MGKFDKYKIDLKGMQADSCKYEFVLDNLFFANIDGPEVQKGKVNVVLVVKKTSRAFELNFQTDGMVWVPCDRCLDDMSFKSAAEIFCSLAKKDTISLYESAK